jgi:leucine dehydrogenase
MSYKAALVNLPLGGGKSVIIKPRSAFNREAYFHQFGRFVNELNGRYITALDSGTALNDMDIIGEHTPYVASLTVHGDPSPATAEGVFHGIQAAVLFKYGKSSLNGLHIAIQGLGHVGYRLASLLNQGGVNLTVADINPDIVKEAVREFKANSVPVDKIHQVQCDVFSPCALGSILNDQTISELQTGVVAGAANNQLAHTHDGQTLHEKGILYAPDYVINAGGLIYAADQYMNGPSTTLTFKEKLSHIHESLLVIFERSQQQNAPTSDIADKLAQEKLA